MEIFSKELLKWIISSGEGKVMGGITGGAGGGVA